MSAWLFSFLILFLTFYLFLAEKEHKQGRSREKGRRRIRSRLRAPSCQHRAGCGAPTHRPRDHDLSQSQMLNRLSHPGAPFEKFLKFIYFERERERENKGGAEREGKRESQSDSFLSAQSPMRGSNPQTMRSCPEPKPRAGF